MHKLKAIIARINGGGKSRITSSLNSIVTTLPPSAPTSTNIPISAASDLRIIENFRLVWLDGTIDGLNNNDSINTIEQLKQIVNTVNKFTNVNECVEFVTNIEDENVFIIVSGALGQDLVPEIHNLSQVDAIYIFCANISRHKEWTKEWVKIKGIHTDIKPICQALQQAAKLCNQDFIAVSFLPVSKEASTQNLDQLDHSFMYTQIFKEVLLEMEDDDRSVQDLAIYCRKFYKDNKYELNIIHEFEQNYQPKSSIWWYTRECFVYQMLNRALRTLDGETINNMGFFIRDLDEQIIELYKKQIGSYHGKSFTVYRGQGLLKADFETLVKTKGGFMSFNNFLSASTSREGSLDFAKMALTKTNMVGILFTMTIDPSVSSIPFASIREVSYYKTQEEVLFTMHIVFRISEINRINHNDMLYQVDLKLTADDDEQLRILTKAMAEKTGADIEWKRLGRFLVN